MDTHFEPERLAELALAAGGSGEGGPHLAACRQCRDDLEEFRRLAARLRTLPEPPPALRERAGAFFARRRALDLLVERLLGEPALRARAARDPEAVLLEAGLEASPELVEAIRDTERTEHPADRRLAAKTLWL